MYQKRKAFENILILGLDVLSIAVSLAIAFCIRYGMIFGRAQEGDQGWLFIFMLVLYAAINIFVDFNDKFFRRGFLEEFESVVKAELILGLSMISILFLLHRSADLSRLVFSYFIIFNTVIMFALRSIFKQCMIKGYKKSKYSSRLLIVTSSRRAKRVIKDVEGYNEWNHMIVGIALTDGKRKEQIHGIPVVANRDTLLDYVIHNDIDEVFIIDEEIRNSSLLEEWVRVMGEMGIIVNVNIDVFDITYSGKKNLNRIGKYAVVVFARNLFSTREMAAKRVLDVLGSLVGMVILGIATVFVAPAIKLDSPGPVFFGQTRVGKNGRKFTFYKFRSMYQDAEERKKALMESNEMNGLMFKMEDDPRITRVGKFIRKTSIDELPQFWNVLKGDMSLVGTRPPTVDEFEQYEAKHKCRLSMTPGLTGMWQISGRSDIKDFDEVVKLDMQYIDNWSILQDIKILMRTVWVVFARKGSR